MTLALLASQAPTPLPRPARTRWQPLRSGLLNLYKYDHEEFWFEDGHLLLRGNNGTGKSRVLALQLPFLLDGEVSPSRVEPDADPAKRMEWNLLMNRYEDRVGYTWLEFGRLTEDGTPAYLTLGCGLSATQGQTGVGKWFFITPQRVGESLWLQGAAGQPLTKERLKEAVSGHGEVFGAAQAYRDAVDARLFGLGRHRYEALVGLLIQLRKPQLTRAFNEELLSGALREALPPLPRRMVDDIAEAFRALEHERVELESFRSAAAAIERFLDTYRRYVHVCVRRRSDKVRSAHSDYDDAQRTLRRAEQRLADANSALQRVEASLEAQQTELQGASAAVTALQESELWREANTLDERRRRSEELARVARQAEEESGRVEAQVAERRARVDTALAAVESAAARVRELADLARKASAEAGFEAAFLKLEASLQGALSRREEPSETAERLNELLAERRRALSALRKLASALQGARREHTEASTAWAARASELEQALTDERDCSAQWDAAREALEQAVGTWHQSLKVLDVGPLSDIEAELAAWWDGGSGDYPLAVRVSARHAHYLGEVKAQQAEKHHALAENHRAQASLEAERRRLAEGQHTPPRAAATRSADARAPGRPGAPLWRLCDFHPSVSAQERAGLEAALEASGLLDAWVTDAGLLPPEGLHDNLLSAGEPLPDGLPRLSDWLKPSLDPADADAARLGDAVVQRVLASLGGREGASLHWVSPEGTYRLGPLSGRWSKPFAEHLGHAAREEARRVELERVDNELTSLAQVRTQLEAERLALVEAEAQARNEADRAPSGAGLQMCGVRLQAAAQLVLSRRQRAAEADARVQHCVLKVTAAEKALTETAVDLGLAAWGTRLEELERCTQAFGERAQKLLDGARREAEHRREQARGEQAMRETLEQLEGVRERVQRARRDAAAAKEAYEALYRAKGASLEDLARQLSDAKGRAQKAQAGLDALRDERSQQAAELEAAGEALPGAQGSLQRATEHRQEAMGALGKLSGLGFLAYVDEALVAEPTETPWNPTRALELARQLESLLGSVEHGDAAWERLGGQMQARFQTLMQELAHSGLFHPEATVVDGVFHVQVGFQNQRLGAEALRGILNAEVLQRQTLLDQRERTLLENHLLGEVASHLHELLHGAERWVGDINAELEKYPMSTGMALRFVWETQAEGPVGLIEARKLLMRNQATWSPEQRARVGAFLKEQIDRARSANPASTWQEHLSTSFDYRAWHTFTIQRHQDGRWLRLTKRTHGTGSGGEKAVALTLPQFAAAAAHYRSARDTAPRLILLDEAFVGVDSDMRGKSMALLATFDLDFVMTSEREWACYGTLPGVAICQLTSHAGIEAVHVSRWVWNGRARTPSDVVLPPSGPPEQPSPA